MRSVLAPRWVRTALDSVEQTALDFERATAITLRDSGNARLDLDVPADTRAAVVGIVAGIQIVVFVRRGWLVLGLGELACVNCRADSAYRTGQVCVHLGRADAEREGGRWQWR